MALNRAIRLEGVRQLDRLLPTDGTPMLFRLVGLDDDNFNTAATTVNFDVTGVPGGVSVQGAFINLRQNFTGGGAATATLSVGTVASPALYVAAQSVFAGTPPRILVGLTLVPGTMAGTAATPLAAGTIRIQLISDVNCSLLTTGQADVYVYLASASIRS